MARRSTTFLSKWIYDRGARSATVLADLGLSREYGYYPGGSSVVDITWTARPTLSTGKPCAAPVTRKVRRTITSAKHHWRELLTLQGVRTSCGAQVRVTGKVTWISGNPVTIEDGYYTGGIVLLS